MNHDNDSDTWASPNIRAYQIGCCTGDYAADIGYRRLCCVCGFGYGRAWYDGRHLRLLRVDVLAYMASLPWGGLVRWYSSAGNIPAEHMGVNEYHALIVMVSRLSARACLVANGGRS